MARPPEALNRILAHLATLNGGEIRAKDLSVVMAMSSNTIINCTNVAVGQGRIVKRAAGREVWYSLGTGRAPAPPAPAGIEFALYHDGDLVIEGLVENEDGTHTIPAAVIARMRTLYGWVR